MMPLNGFRSAAFFDFVEALGELVYEALMVLRIVTLHLLRSGYFFNYSTHDNSFIF